MEERIISSCGGTRRCILGRAKEKMFGKKPAKWPDLQRRVDAGEILAIELAYAEMATSDPAYAKVVVETLAKARAGHLTDLPKHQHLIETIVSHANRLIEELAPPTASLPSALNAEQKKAVEAALQNRFSIITGGPGTGKTFTATAIIEALQLKTCACAPTGKAASHLLGKLSTEATGGTLHSLLGVRSPLDYAKPPEEIDAELILVDECSMIDPQLFARLLTAIPQQARLILMGDVNQLPAVEGGSVFADLIVSGAIPTTTLNTCMRSDRTEILDLASKVLKGELVDIRTHDLGFASGSIEEIYQKLWKYVRGRDFNDFRILSTLRKGPLGVNALNRYLFEKFQSDRYPILVNRNDPKKGLSNGDTAMVEGAIATFADGRSWPLNQLSSYEYAYCISVHKAQGSEYKDVLFLVPDGSELFGREVIYTAITRAKEMLAIDGNPDQIQKAIAHSTLKPSAIIESLSSRKLKV